MGLAPVIEAPIAFTLMCSELRAYCLERNDLDRRALDDCDWIAFAIEDDAQISYLGWWLIERGVLHGQTGCCSLLARENKSCQFISDFSFATETKGIWLRLSSWVMLGQRLNELCPVGFAFGFVYRHDDWSQLRRFAEA